MSNIEIAVNAWYNEWIRVNKGDKGFEYEL